jgi:long-chain acyl-CoA synthetase
MEKITWEEIESRRGTFIKGEWPTITEQFHIAVHDYPEETAFSQFSPKEVHLTYAQAFDNVRRVAGWLVSKGFKKGDRAVLTGKNSPWWAIAYLGVLEAGGVIVPLDVQMEEKTAEHLIKLTDAVFLFADKDKFEKTGKRGSGVKHKISLTQPDAENSDTAGKSRRLPFIGGLPEIKKDLQFDQAEENDLAAILFTSGTTGLEKGVMLTHANFMAIKFA